jgi:hypothetical protein
MAQGAHSREVHLSPRVTSAALVAALALTVQGTAWGQGASVEDTAECISAADQGQKLRNERKLLEARRQFFLCARASCPTLLRRDCTEWAERANADIPTVVFRARDEVGNDIVDARVSIDRSPTLEPIDGRRVSVDPGPHVFVIEGHGDRAERTVVLADGDRREVAVTLARPATVPPSARERPAALEVARPGLSAPPTLSLVLGGVALVGLGGFAYFGATGTSDADGLRDGCSKTASCRRADVDAIERKYLVADISLGVAIAALAGAVVLWITQPRHEPAQPLAGR